MSEISTTITESSQSSTAPSHTQARKQSSNLTILVLFVIIAVLIGYIFGKSLHEKSMPVSTSIAAKQAELDARVAATNQKREQLGLPPLQGYGSDEGEKIAERITRDAISLATYVESFRNQILEKDRFLEKRNEELIASEQTRTALTSQIAKLQLKIDNNENNKDASIDLKERLAVAESQITSLRQQLAESANIPVSDELTAAKTKILDLEAQLGAYQSMTEDSATPKMPDPKLFAASETDLLPHAQALYRALSQLEDKPDSEINQIYNKLALQHKASFIRAIQFDTDSSTLKPLEQSSLLSALGDLPDGTMILVVGYASTVGNAEHNRTLSSTRAEECAKIANIHKSANQKVQAVYYGQTKRFSSRIPERNQICEVWAILP